jgi:hypothetical protein
MKAKDIFGLAVRIIGLVFLYQGLEAVLMAIANFWQMPRFNFGVVVMNLLAVAWRLAVAWWLVGGAGWLMRLAYPDEGAKRPATNGAAAGVEG